MAIRYGQLCPIAKASEVLGERWTILIVRELLLGSKRYSQLQRGLSQISPTVLTKRLNQLVDCGLLERRAPSVRAHAEYHLTPAGRELTPVVNSLGAWGMKWARGQMRDGDLDVQMLMLDLSRRLDESKLPVDRAVIAFNFTRMTRFASWWIVIEPGRPHELCVDHPGKPVDLHIRCDVRTLAEIWAGDTTFAAAIRADRLTLSGDRKFLRSVSRWLRAGALAHIRPAAEPLRVD